MILEDISFNNFRNLENNHLAFSDKVNIFVGLNGQGKTNLLEAIYLLSITKSFRTNKMSNIALYQNSGFKVEGNFKKNNFNYVIEFYFDKGKKQISINKNSNAKFKDVIGLLNAVLFVPEDLMMLKGSPNLRRKVMDIELSKLSSKYLLDLSAYYHLLKQRNAFLKQDLFDDKYLDSIDSLLSNYGISLIKQREAFIKELSSYVAKIYQELSSRSQDVKIEYLANIKAEEFEMMLFKNRQRDLVTKVTNVGIHRDDFKVLIDGKDASVYASQGEQRSLILAIKLALVEYIHAKTNEYPILLLDDVLSELDDTRQNNLIKYLSNDVQTFITTTSLKNIKEELCNKAKIYRINEGRIKEARYDGSK